MGRPFREEHDHDYRHIGAFPNRTSNTLVALRSEPHITGGSDGTAAGWFAIHLTVLQRRNSQARATRSQPTLAIAQAIGLAAFPIPDDRLQHSTCLRAALPSDRGL